MIRKRRRFKGLVLGLAFAALAIPATSGAVTGYLVDGGPAPVSHLTVSHPTVVSPSYLRYHEAGAAVATVTPLQADGMRWQAMADAYRQTNNVAMSERSNGVAGPDPSLVPVLASSTSSGFDWQDAGIGAAGAFGVALLLLTAVALARRSRSDLDHSGLTSA